MISKRFAGNVLIGLAFLVATGCGSFNNSFNHNTPPKPAIALLSADDSDYAARNQPIAPVPIDKTVAPNGTKACDLNPYVQLPPPPELPTKEFQAAADLVEIEKIERKHIRDLRSYIAEVLRLQQKNQMAFYEKCNVISK